MKTLTFICPFCMREKKEKIDVTAHYNEDDTTIPWECPSCKVREQWDRVPIKTSLLNRLLKKLSLTKDI